MTECGNSSYQSPRPRGWAFAGVLDDADTLALEALLREIPDNWIDQQHGGRRAPERLHTTLVLKMNSGEHLRRLQRICLSIEPIHVSVQEVFFERVHRISDAEVYCIGVALRSAGLRSIKDAWIAEEPSERRAIHVPYESDGHISLAYIRSDCRDVANKFVESRSAFCHGRSLTVESLTFQEGSRKVTISLEGKAERSSKEARSTLEKTTRTETITIDGSILEGGGQILRMSGAYAAIFGVPVNVTKIRAGRSKPGLAAQHLECWRLLRDITDAELTNDYIGSREVNFIPKVLTPGTYSADPGTAGAITLMVQASLIPCLLSSPCHCSLKGGTNVAFSPPFEFCRRVFLPALERMGACVDAVCDRRGFYPRGGGSVKVDVRGIRTGTLQAIDLSMRGEPESVEAVLYCTQAFDEQGALDSAYSVLKSLAPHWNGRVEVVNGEMGKFWIDVVVTTTTQAMFHGSSEPQDTPGSGRSKGNRKGKRGDPRHSNADIASLCRAAAQEVYRSLAEQLSSGAAVDEHLVDQLILPASLASGRSVFLGKLSLHARTAIHIAQLMVPGVRCEQRECGVLTFVEIHGIGLAQKATEPPEGVTTVYFQLPQGSLSTSSEMLDFQTDMRHVASITGAHVSVSEERVQVSGVSLDVEKAKVELRKVLPFYFGADIKV